MPESAALPENCKAVLLHEYGQDLVVQTIPTPQPTLGTIIVKINSTPIYGPWRAMFKSPRSFWSHFTPFGPSGISVGRVAAIGPDTTAFKPGQLVVTDYFVRGRDNPEGVQFLRGGTTMGNSGAEKIARELYATGAWAEYMRVAHENCHAVDESLFLGSPSDGGLGWKIEQLPSLVWMAIVYSGLRDIDLKAGETIVILPATGVFGGAAVEAASAMGARVIAGGRNTVVLAKLARSIPNVKTVQLTGDVVADTASITAHHGHVECFLDISSPGIPNSNHIAAGIGSLATYGRASMMGGSSLDIPLNYGPLVAKSLTLKGRFMYGENSVRDLIKLAAVGAIKPSRIDVSRTFKLEEWKEALKVAEETHGWGTLVSLVL